MLVVATIVGLGLRVYALPGQILADDEWHAVHKLLNSNFRSILTDFGSNDHCIPLTLFYSVLSRLLPLNELWMRLPALLSGIVLVPVLPILLRRQISSRASVTLCWLLAVSPFHIYYSRLARPYAITLLLTWVSVVAFFRWWEGGHSGWKWLYTAAAILSPWFHLVTLPAVLGPPMFAAADLVRGRGRGAADWLKTLAWTATGQAIFLAPPFFSSTRAVSHKLLAGSPNLQTFSGAAELLVGTAQTWLLAGCGLLALAGVVALSRQQIDFLALLCVTALAQLGSVLLLAPRFVEIPVALARYDLFLLPAVLALTAVGATWLTMAVTRRNRSLAGWFTLAVPACLLWFGPLPRIFSYPNNWIGHPMWQDDYGYSRWSRPETMPKIYDELALLPPGSSLVLEAPWRFDWHYFPYYQNCHRQRTMIGFVAPPGGPVRPGETLLGDARFRWLNAIHVSDRRQLVQKGVDWVIFHKQLSAEMPPPFEADPVDVLPWIRNYESLYGPPWFEDDFVAGFMIRGTRAPSREPGNSP